MLVFWLVLGVVLLGIEMRHLAFYALFGAVGSLAAAGVAFFAPEAVPVQAIVAIAIAAVGIVAIRPLMSKAMHRNDGGPLGRGVHGTLVGEEVITLDEVGAAHDVGHVRLAGERWLAVSGSGERIPPSTTVLVTGVRGTTLVVWPVDGRTVFPETEARGGEPADPDRREQDG